MKGKLRFPKITISDTVLLDGSILRANLSRKNKASLSSLYSYQNIVNKSIKEDQDEESIQIQDPSVLIERQIVIQNIVTKAIQALQEATSKLQDL